MAYIGCDCASPEPSGKYLVVSITSINRALAKLTVSGFVHHYSSGLDLTRLPDDAAADHITIFTTPEADFGEPVPYRVIRARALHDYLYRQTKYFRYNWPIRIRFDSRHFLRPATYINEEPTCIPTTPEEFRRNIDQRILRARDITRLVIEPNPPISLRFKAFNDNGKCIGFENSRAFHMLHSRPEGPIHDAVTFNLTDGFGLRVNFSVAIATPRGSANDCPFGNSLCALHATHQSHSPPCPLPKPKSIITTNSSWNRSLVIEDLEPERGGHLMEAETIEVKLSDDRKTSTLFPNLQFQERKTRTKSKKSKRVQQETPSDRMISRIESYLIGH